MLDGQFLAFVGVALVLSLTPGPDMALVLRNGLRGGRPAAYRTILGIAVGLVGWALATAFGVAAVLAASSTAFTGLKVAGGIYLAYLGIRALLALRAPPGGRAEPDDREPTGSPFRQGLATNLLNPKLAAIFTTLVPQFVSEDDPALPKTVLFVVVFVAIGLSWLVLYANIVHVLVRRPRIQRAVQALSGVVLIGLGARLLLERAP